MCQILIEMEKYLKRPMVSYFNWIGGTSAGAFIACALCVGVPLKELRQICFDVKDEVFSGGRPYNSKFLERVLKRTYGTTTRLSDIKGHKLAVTTVLADREPCQLRLFRNYSSPANMLERFGYASDTFNNMSGHAVVSRWSQGVGGGKGNTETMVKLATNDHQATSADKNALKAKDGLGTSPDGGSSSSVKQPSVGANKRPQENGIAKVVANNQQQSRKDETTTQTSVKDPILDENDPDPIIWQAVRASSAAPFFFKPYGPYLDGGIISNNPTLDMLNEFESYHKVRRFLRRHVKDGDISQTERNQLNPECSDKLNLVVSLGTGRGRVIGRQAMVDFSQVASGFATVFSPIELVRSIRAARDFFKKLMQQSCHTDDYILDRAQAWCSSLDIPYFRLNPPLATIFSIDDKRDEQLINALWQTKLYMRAMKDQLCELAELLDGPG